jgi:hypothetical protein
LAANGFVVLTLVFRQEGRVWTGECRELGTATYGRSLSRTHDELLEMVKDHLSVLEEVGERDRFFKQHDIQYYPSGSPLAEVQQSLPIDDEVYVHAHRIAIPA